MAWALWVKARTQSHESIVLEHLAPRTALLAGMLVQSS